MNAGPEQFTATSYFDGDKIVKRLNDVAIEFSAYLAEGMLSYLVHATDDEKREVFTNFVQQSDHSSIDAFLDVLIWAKFLEKQQTLDASLYQQEELLTRYIQSALQSDNDSADEESYW